MQSTHLSHWYSVYSDCLVVNIILSVHNSDIV